MVRWQQLSCATACYAKANCCYGNMGYSSSGLGPRKPQPKCLQWYGPSSRSVHPPESQSRLKLEDSKLNVRGQLCSLDLLWVRVRVSKCYLKGSRLERRRAWVSFARRQTSLEGSYSSWLCVILFKARLLWSSLVNAWQSRTSWPFIESCCCLTKTRLIWEFFLCHDSFTWSSSS